jgi:hypothetical protein
MNEQSNAWLDGYMTARTQAFDVAMLHRDEHSEISILELLAGLRSISEQRGSATCEADKQKILVQQEAMENAACQSRVATFMADNIANAIGAIRPPGTDISLDQIALGYQTKADR